MTNDTERDEPKHGDPHPSGVGYWCVDCKTYISESNWDFHAKYHNPNKDVPEGDTHIGQSGDMETE